MPFSSLGTAIFISKLLFANMKPKAAKLSLTKTLDIFFKSNKNFSSINSIGLE